MQAQALRINKGFSLIELTVALTVFAIIITASGGTFASIQRAWQRQKRIIDTVQNARWAMEFMVNEIRGGGNLSVLPGERVWFELPPGGPLNRVWYWRGNGGVFGSRSIIFRGPGTGWGNANNNRQELVNLIVDNPTGNDVFRVISNLYIIELTVEKDGQQYTLRSQVKQRN